MEQKILVFAGSKQSGKSSAANFVSGYFLRLNNVIREFSINEDGNLITNARFYDEFGNPQDGYGILDLQRRDIEFLRYAKHNIWPHVKVYNIADALKEVAIGIFGIDEQKVFGTDEDKNGPSGILWENMCSLLNPYAVQKIKDEDKFFKEMTIREFLQFFGTNVCRKLKDSCWMDVCAHRILSEGSNLAVVADCRFPNEVEHFHRIGAKIVLLKSQKKSDDHSSETAIHNMRKKDFDFIIDNTNMTILEKNMQILDILKELGWVQSEII